MWSWLFGNPKLIAIGGAIMAGLLFVWRVLAGAKKAGVNEQKVKEAEARDENLKKIRNASDAAAAAKRVPNDPNNRDND